MSNRKDRSQEQSQPTIITGKLHRLRGRQWRFSSEPPPPTAAPVRRPARVAVMLALAHTIQRRIDEGDLWDRADAARRMGLTRARVTQLLDLTLLAPDIQEQVLHLESVDGLELMSDRTLQPIAHVVSWAEQRERWAEVRD